MEEVRAERDFIWGGDKARGRGVGVSYEIQLRDGK